MIGSRISARTPWEKNYKQFTVQFRRTNRKITYMLKLFQFFCGFHKIINSIPENLICLLFGELTSQAAWRTCYVGYEKINGILEWVNKWSKGSHDNKLKSQFSLDDTEDKHACNFLFSLKCPLALSLLCKLLQLFTMAINSVSTWSHELRFIKKYLLHRNLFKVMENMIFSNNCLWK